MNARTPGKIFMAGALMLLGASMAHGDAVDDCGKENDPRAAVTICTRALAGSGLTKEDRRLALVARAHAHIGMGNALAAIADYTEAIEPVGLDSLLDRKSTRLNSCHRT